MNTKIVKLVREGGKDPNQLDDNFIESNKTQNIAYVLYKTGLRVRLGGTKMEWVDKGGNKYKNDTTGWGNLGAMIQKSDFGKLRARYFCHEVCSLDSIFIWVLQTK